MPRRSFLTGIATCFTAPAWARPRAHRVLFVGNSFTRQHNIPDLVDALAAENGVRLHVAAIAYNGRTLSQHVRDPDLYQLAEDVRPDTVILQEHSKEPLSLAGRARSAQAMMNLRPLAPNAVLFPAWPRRYNHRLYRTAGMPKTPEAMARIIIQHHLTQGARIGASVAPVTQAWLRAVHAGMHLYSDDGYHASPAGAWLVAAALTQSLGIPVTRFQSHPRGMHSATARFLAGLGAIGGS